MLSTVNTRAWNLPSKERAFVEMRLQSSPEMAHTLNEMFIKFLFFFFLKQIFLLLIIMCLMLAIGHGIWESSIGYYFQVFLPWKSYVSSSAVSSLATFWSYFIVLNTMVPISLYVRQAPVTHWVMGKGVPEEGGRTEKLSSYVLLKFPGWSVRFQNAHCLFHNAYCAEHS